MSNSANQNLENFYFLAQITPAQILDLQTQNTALKTENTDLQTKNTNLQAQVTNLQTENTNLQGQVTNLQTKNTNLQTKNANLQTQVTNLQTKNTDLQTENTNLQGQVTNLQTENTNRKTENTTLQTHNTDLKTENTDLQTKNTDLQTQVDSSKETAGALERIKAVGLTHVSSLVDLYLLLSSEEIESLLESNAFPKGEERLLAAKEELGRAIDTRANDAISQIEELTNKIEGMEGWMAGVGMGVEEIEQAKVPFLAHRKRLEKKVDRWRELATQIH